MSYGNTLRDGGGIPLSSVYIAGNTVPQPLLGSPLSHTDTAGNTANPVAIANQLQTAILLGKGYVATTGMLATATNSNLVMGMCVWNPANSGKSLYIYSIKWTSASTSTNSTLKYAVVTANPAYATTITPAPLQVGSSTTSITTVTSAANSATASITVTGTVHDIMYVNSKGTFEYLTGVEGVYLPNGTAAGLTVYGTVATAGDTWGATVRWIEF